MSIPKAERMQFKVGKYDVIAQPMNGSAHMLRYTVRLHGKRIFIVYGLDVIEGLALHREHHCKDYYY